VYAMDSSFITKCGHKNENKVLSSSTSYLAPIRKGHHRVTVEGFYKGSIVAFSTEAVIKLEWDKETTLRELYEKKTKRSK
ncbi:MAG: hypothetical protein GY950_22275, partial [bacterium]|nr:hypothetical protein [bacterium]